MKLSHILMIALAPLVFTGCLKSEKPSEGKALPASLALTGAVLDAAGAGAGGVAVYLEESDEPLALTDDAGSYTINLDDDSLIVLQGKIRNRAQSFRLFFDAENGQKGVSLPINLGERGDRSLDAVTIGDTATIEGRVMLKAEGRKVEPGSAVQVRVGRSATSTDSNGNFSLAGVPAGALTLAAEAPQFASAVKDLTVAGGETKKLTQPLVLFPEAGVAGAVFLDESIPASDFLISGHPYMRAFRPAWSKATKFMRYSYDINGLLTLPWKSCAERFDFDFAKDGGNVLYYQFSDEAQGVLSDIQSLAVVLDQFANTQGVVIEDGSGHITRRDVVLKFDLPQAAYRMRIAESTESLLTKPWLNPAATMNYTFEIYTNPANGQKEGFGQRTIYVQYMDAIGLVSPVYVASAVIDLFPSTADEVFKIDIGAATTQNRLVRCDINVPVNAFEMRVWEVNSSSGGGGFFGGGSSGRDTSNLWLAVQPYMFYTFQAPGIKTVYLQFRTREQMVSPTYQQVIRVDPFPQIPTGFVINGGAPTTDSPNVMLTLIPPPTAIAFKVTNTAGSGGGGGGGLGNLGGSGSTDEFINLVPSFPYTLSAAGPQTLYVQYRTIDGDESQLYAKTIEFNPYLPNGAFDINNGAPLTIDPVLNITNIVAPPTAAFMNISYGSPSSTNTTEWQYITSTVPYRVYTPGLQTIFIMFKTANGIVLPAIQRSVIYDPWPFNASGVIVDNGAASTTDANVTLTIWNPGNAVKMRVSNDLNTINTAIWLPFSYSLSHVISTTAGDQKVYIQFQTINGEVSPAYFDDITKI